MFSSRNIEQVMLLRLLRASVLGGSKPRPQNCSEEQKIIDSLSGCLVEFAIFRQEYKAISCFG